MIVSKEHEKPGRHCRAVGLSASAALQSTAAGVHGCCCRLQVPATGCRCFFLSSWRGTMEDGRRNATASPARGRSPPTQRRAAVRRVSASEIAAMEDMVLLAAGPYPALSLATVPIPLFLFLMFLGADYRGG